MKSFLEFIQENKADVKTNQKLAPLFRNVVMNESSNIPMSNRTSVGDAPWNTSAYLQNGMNKAKKIFGSQTPIATMTTESGDQMLVYELNQTEKAEFGNIKNLFCVYSIKLNITFVAKFNINTSYVTPLDNDKYVGSGSIKWEHPYKYRYLVIDKNATLKFL